jgi:hypothetical protein
MSYTTDQLLVFATNFDKYSSESLDKSAKKKEKLDPKAKVRNRGTACVPAESAKDKKDHFPINDEAQARNALARVHQYTSAPEWYSGSLKGLQALVARKVKAKYPKIDVGGKDSKKKKSAYYETVLRKLGQETNYGDMTEYELAELANKGEVHQGTQFYGEPWLRNLMNNGKISGKQYNSAKQVYQLQYGNSTPSGNQSTQSTPTAPAPTQQSGKAGPLQHRDDVENAQKRLNSMIMSGQLKSKALDPDGKLGNLTRGVLKEYKEFLGLPSFTDEQIIKSLNQTPQLPAQSTWVDDKMKGKQEGPVQTWATPAKPAEVPAPSPAAAPGQTTT